MKYRLLKDLLWLKAGEVVETKDGNSCISEQHFSRNGGELIKFYPNVYPDFFEPITEEDEKESNRCKQHKITGPVVGGKFRCLICDDLCYIV